jgi:hypothetical protein
MSDQPEQPTQPTQAQFVDREQLLNTIADMFSYHPPQSEWRRAAHEEVNDCAFRFAKAFVVMCPDLTNAELMQVITAIQQARWLANQILTYKEIGLSLK